LAGDTARQIPVMIERLENMYDIRAFDVTVVGEV
jgi:hypothetical protein